CSTAARTWVNQDSEGKLLMHGLQLLDSLAHGVFLRSLPSRATGWWFPNRKNAPFSFSTSRGTRPHANVRGCFIVVEVDALLARQRRRPPRRQQRLRAFYPLGAPSGIVGRACQTRRRRRPALCRRVRRGALRAGA